ncbi:MAG: pirin family protein [Flavobacteriaceae bacterium]
MKKRLFPADQRGHADHGWLKTYHSFSFANYFNPDCMNFGVLRVLNDDFIKGGGGFGTHPHDNMEIITIPFAGDLEHKDSMGNVGLIRQGDIQVMSAGTGILHSEYNKNQEVDVELFQIWVFPNKKDVTPRYDQISISELKTTNSWYQILSPTPDDQGVWIHQDAWFHMGDFTADTHLDYTFKNPANGLYIMVIEGTAEVGGEKLHKRDAIGLWELSSISFDVAADSQLLLMEIPLLN